MNLKEYIDKKIKITLNDGQILIGDCIEYTNAIENDPEVDSIDVKIKKDIYEIYIDEIKEIEII
jgi:small nuclear ribonucleoprotein (snRNP)-like protein